MRKICAITANRADFSRIETILQAVEKHSDLELQLIVMGSHLIEITGKTIDEIKRKGFSVNYTIYMEVAGSNPITMTKSVGLAINELSTALDHLQPDIVIVPVDRFESLAMGITPALMNIHVAHVQGGEVTGTIDESIRHALTKMAHLHFVATEKSRERVIKMGEPEATIFNVGCPGTDLLLQMPAMDNKTTIIEVNKLMKEEIKFDPSEPFLFMLQHPVTTEFSDSERQILETLMALESFNEQTLILWPNIDAGSDDISRVIRRYLLNSSKRDKIKILKHVPTEIFINVLRNTLCQIGNASSGIREACYFGTPVVNVGTRQTSRERGKNVLDIWYDRKEIARAIKSQIDHGKYPVEHIYGDGTAGKQVAEVLATIDLPNIQKKITY